MLYSALVLGLLGSLHCLGMCGPIAFLLPVDRSNHLKSGGQVLIYHIGRLLAYASMGAVFGLLGSGINMFGAQQKLSIIIGALMILLALIPYQKLGGQKVTGFFYKAISGLKNKLGKTLQRKTPDAFFSIGVLNGFLPCGLVYMALLGATAMADPLSGSVYMAVFGLGTIPLMSAAVYLARIIKSSMRNRLRRLIPVFVVIIGALFILRGMGLGIPYVSPKPMKTMAATSMECHSHENELINNAD